jgi:hypothetical protein
MSRGFRTNAIVVGILFIVTMLLGMIDSYFVAPKLATNLSNMQNISDTILIGVFSVLFMAIGIVAIATTLYPVVKRQSEAIAMTYVGFRIVECFLLIFGAILYLFLLANSGAIFSSSNLADKYDIDMPKIVTIMKLDAFQLSMVILGIGSTLLNYSFYKSKVIPQWLSIWGMVGYILLFFSALFALIGIANTSNGIGIFMYIPGGLWELVVFPIWLFIKGFDIKTEFEKK